MDAERAASISESVIHLQETIRMFRKDIQDGRRDFVLEPIDNSSLSNTFPHLTRLVSATADHESQLQELDDQVKSLEDDLRLQAQWHPPAHTSTPPLSVYLDVPDLTSAIHLLRYITASANPSRRLTPRQSLSKHFWLWHSEWKEFYTYLSGGSIYLFLSRWKYDVSRNVWEHVPMASTDLTPDTAAGTLGAWEDWKWDEEWGEWCLDVSEEEDGNGVGAVGVRCCIFPTRWEESWDGEWIYAGTGRDELYMAAGSEQHT